MKAPMIQLGAALVLALAALGGYVLWYGYVQGLETQAASLAADVAAKDADRAQAASARSAEADVSEKERFVASHLVLPSDIVSFLESLENTGKSLGADVQVASVSDETAAAAGTISLSLSVSGPFDAVMRTLGAIEEGPYAAAARDLSLDTANGQDWTAAGTFVVGTSATSTAPAAPSSP